MASKKPPVLKPIEVPAIDRSLTKSAFVGNLTKVRELVEPVTGKPAAIGDKDMSVDVVMFSTPFAVLPRSSIHDLHTVDSSFCCLQFWVHGADVGDS